ncbi:putative quinol monooxygenase [Terricaulis sp.]|uniref:putative quinol monooxygenase n=1 Tax=Terricaulis sp. TaxID=2768686 RepID=UPI0037842C3E
MARLETLAGREDGVLALLADMAFAVRAEEDACVSYAVTRCLGSQHHIAIHARFADWQAFKDHAETAHMKRLMPRLSPFLAAPIALEIFLEV